MASSSVKLPSLPLPTPKPDEISKARIEELAHAYPAVAARLLINTKTTNLAKDEYRFHELPPTVAKRRGQPSPANSKWTSGWLEKGELQLLMDWKLHRGTWRPSLPGLIKSNDDAKVIHDTAEAFALLEESDSLSSSDPAAKAASSFPKAALKAAARLKGVGPATASLVLATAAPDMVPFMADELYAWFFGRKPEKYNDKELAALWDEVANVRKRLDGVSAQDVERAVAVMAWARDGKVEGWKAGEDEGVDGSGNGEDSVGEKKEAVVRKTEEKAGKTKNEGGKVGKGSERKRKAEKATTHGSRKSARTAERQGKK